MRSRWRRTAACRSSSAADPASKWLSRRISLGPGLCPVALVRDRRLEVRRVCRVLFDAADEIERGVQRLLVLWIRRAIRIRARLLLPLGLKVSAERRLAARVGARFAIPRP